MDNRINTIEIITKMGQVQYYFILTFFNCCMSFHHLRYNEFSPYSLQKLIGILSSLLYAVPMQMLIGRETNKDTLSQQRWNGWLFQLDLFIDPHLSDV